MKKARMNSSMCAIGRESWMRPDVKVTTNFLLLKLRKQWRILMGNQTASKRNSGAL